MQRDDFCDSFFRPPRLARHYCVDAEKCTAPGPVPLADKIVEAGPVTAAAYFGGRADVAFIGETAGVDAASAGREEVCEKLAGRHGTPGKETRCTWFPGTPGLQGGLDRDLVVGVVGEGRRVGIGAGPFA